MTRNTKRPGKHDHEHQQTPKKKQPRTPMEPKKTMIRISTKLRRARARTPITQENMTTWWIPIELRRTMIVNTNKVEDNMTTNTNKAQENNNHAHQQSPRKPWPWTSLKMDENMKDIPWGVKIAVACYETCHCHYHKFANNKRKNKSTQILPTPISVEEINNQEHQ